MNPDALAAYVAEALHTAPPFTRAQADKLASLWQVPAARVDARADKARRAA